VIRPHLTPSSGLKHKIRGDVRYYFGQFLEKKGVKCFLKLSKRILGLETQVLNYKLCENDKFGVQMDLGRSKHYILQFSKKNQTIFYFFLQFIDKRVLKIMITPD
jgi:hypothetical protein